MTVIMVIELPEDAAEKLLADVEATKAYMASIGLPILDIKLVDTDAKGNPVIYHVPCSGGCGRLVSTEHPERETFCVDCYLQRIAP